MCINQGEGGTPARPDLVGGGQVKMTDVLVYPYYSPILNVRMTGNTFYNRNERNRVYSVSTIGSAFFEKAEMDHNSIYLPKGSSICMSTDNGEGVHSGKELPFAEWQAEYKQDIHSTFTAIGSQPDKYTMMEQLAMTSMDFDAIIEAVADAGIKTNICL